MVNDQVDALRDEVRQSNLTIWYDIHKVNNDNDYSSSFYYIPRYFSGLAVSSIL